MYAPRAALTDNDDTHDLQQGDVLADLLLPALPTGANFALLRGNKVDWPAKAESLRDADPKLRVFPTPSRQPLAVVVSNSCDNSTGKLPVLVAPARPFTFQDPGAAAGDAVRQWREISEAATGTATPKLFYLPSSEEFGFSRSEVVIPEMTPLSHDYLARCVREAGLRRLCGLTPAAQRHLQWAISLMFSRDPREDDEWPSKEDFALKLQWIEAEIARGTPRHAALVVERERIRQLLGGE